MSDAKLTIDALKRIEDIEYDNVKKGFAQIKRVGFDGPKLLRWYPIQKVSLDGLSGYRIALLFQQKSSSPVYLEEYKLDSGKRIHTITFSYRQSEESFWKEDYDTIKRRIKFHLKK